MSEIVKYPNVILKRGCSPVTIVGNEEKDILQRMVKTMYLNRGAGLAAPQIGINKQLAVVDIGDERLIKLINPVVMEPEGTEIMEEGCLSIPNLYIHLKRAKRIKVKLLNENGQEFVFVKDGILYSEIFVLHRCTFLFSVE